MNENFARISSKTSKVRDFLIRLVKGAMVQHVFWYILRRIHFCTATSFEKNCNRTLHDVFDDFWSSYCWDTAVFTPVIVYLSLVYIVGAVMPNNNLKLQLCKYVHAGCLLSLLQDSNKASVLENRENCFVLS